MQERLRGVEGEHPRGRKAAGEEGLRALDGAPRDQGQPLGWACLVRLTSQREVCSFHSNLLLQSPSGCSAGQFVPSLISAKPTAHTSLLLAERIVGGRCVLPDLMPSVDVQRDTCIKAPWSLRTNENTFSRRVQRKY